MTSDQIEGKGKGSGRKSDEKEKGVSLRPRGATPRRELTIDTIPEV